MMDWQKLDKQRTSEIIQRVASTPDGGLFSVQTSEAQSAQVSFYRNFGLVRLINFATLPSFTLDFLSDGNSLYLLDGSADPLKRVADRGALQITERNVVDYVDFFFSHVTTEEGDVYLIRDMDETTFMDSLSLDQQIQIKEHSAPIEVAYDRDRDVFLVKADLYFAGVLLKAMLSVQADGQIEISDHAMLMNAGGNQEHFNELNR